jgi:hypothetical protein
LDLDQDATDRLIRSAVEEWRPVDWQAQVLLYRALGLEVGGPRVAPADPSERDEVAS